MSNAQEYILISIVWLTGVAVGIAIAVIRFALTS